jgi:hypothetical protein
VQAQGARAQDPAHSVFSAIALTVAHLCLANYKQTLFRTGFSLKSAQPIRLEKILVFPHKPTLV